MFGLIEGVDESSNSHSPDVGQRGGGCQENFKEYFDFKMQI